MFHIYIKITPCRNKKLGTVFLISTGAVKIRGGGVKIRTAFLKTLNVSSSKGIYDLPSHNSI